MCNLYASTMPQAAMRQLFGVTPEQDHLGNFEPLRAIFPKYDGPVFHLDAAGEPALALMHWGFVMPQTSKKTGAPIQPKAINNARDDKVRISGFWRRSFTKGRCLIPATSFCEAKGRQPADYHWFEVDDGAPFAFAGMWRRYEGLYKDEPVAIDTYTMLTSTPNDMVRPVHQDRMPVILDAADYDTWLRGDEDAAAILMRPFPAERMRLRAHGHDLRSEPEGSI